MDPIALRVARAQDAARQRAERLRALVPELVAILEGRGAVRVWLFGSLANGMRPHAGTDIDLCVEGLSSVGFDGLVGEFLERTGDAVDLVRWETASPTLRERLSREGIRVLDVAA